MNCRSIFSTVILVSIALVVAGCQDQRTTADNASSKGAEEARQDIARGILKQKEYPPLPYSLTQINFIKLIKSECGVEWEVVQGPANSKPLRDEVQAYNAAMRLEIERKFGAGIFQKLQEKAEKREKAPRPN